MKILVTGGLGNIGLEVSSHLLERGYELQIIDHKAVDEIDQESAQLIKKAQYLQVDINNFEMLKEYCQGVDQIVHLAAIPYPIQGQESEIFKINVSGTYNVYQAAADLGINRVISASSINFLGNGFGIRPIEILYFPIDEEHPGHTTDVYAYSKQLVENIAAYFWRRNKITSACLRFPFVFNPTQFPIERRDQYLHSIRDSFAQIMDLPQDKRRDHVKMLLDTQIKLRKRRNQGDITYPEMWQTLNDLPGGMLLFGYPDFWTNLHVKDAALSIEMAILAEYEGVQPFYVAAPNNSLGVSTRDLVDLFYPQVSIWKKEIRDNQTLLNCDKARQYLGFEASIHL